MMNDDLPPQLRERSSQPELQRQLPLDPPEEEPVPPPQREEAPRPAEPYLRRG